MHAGDLINLAHRDSEWAEWFEAGGFIHRQWTALPVAGNHEFQPLGDGDSRSLSIQWRPQFTLETPDLVPENLHETVYSVVYQGMQFLALNSNESLEEQMTFLEQELENSSARWKVVVCHHSIFSPAKGRDFEFGRKKWKPLLDRYGVDLVLNGHDHTYARGHVPMVDAENKEATGIETVYVTSVSGPKQYQIDPGQLKAYKKEGYTPDKTGEQTQFFQVLSLNGVNGDQLDYTAYTALGETYDSFSLIKNFETGRKELVNK